MSTNDLIETATQKQELSASAHMTFLASGPARLALDTQKLEQALESEAFDATDRDILGDILASLSTSGDLPFPWSAQEVLFLHHNPHRTAEYLVYRYKMRLWPQRRILGQLPIHLLVEPSSICNLRCVMCYQSDPTFTAKENMGLMDMGLFREIIDQAAAGGVKALTMAPRGEPLLHKEFGAMLDYIGGKDAFLDVKVNTNAMRLTEDMAHRLLSSPVNLAVISVDSADKETYERIRVRGKFETVVENVRRLHQIRASHYPSSKVEIRISGVKIDPDQDEKAFHDFWSPMCDTVTLVHAAEQWDTYHNELHPDLKRPCSLFWERLYVWYDGACNPCEADYLSRLSPGSARDRSLAEIWCGPEMERLRQTHLAGERGGLIPCDRCGL